MTTRATHEIQTDAMRIANVTLPGAIEAEDWVAVARIAEQLQEIAQRGLYHASRERLAEINAFAMNGHQEREPR